MDQILNYLQKAQNESIQKISREVIRAPEMMQQDYNQDLERNGEDTQSIFLVDKNVNFYEQKFAKLVDNLENVNFVSFFCEILQFKIIPNDFIIQQILFFKGN